MNKTEEIKTLIKQLNIASEAYYNTGSTLMTDKEFDAKLEELRTLEKETGIIFSNSPTQNVGAAVLGKLEKVVHGHKPMLSLEKVHSAEEIIEFANGQELIAMIKLDGLSIRLTYEDGKLVRGETRGNGIEGSDVTEHVKQFKNVPLFINKKGTYVVDGEAIITDKDFESINTALPVGTEKYKNSRNLAAGTLSLLDVSLIKERHLRFVLWDIIAGDDSKFFVGRIHNARELGFTVVDSTGCELNKDSVSVVNDIILNYAKEKGYPCDGVVWKINNVAHGETLGQTSHHFNNAVAFKAKQDEYETVLRDIEWTMGKTGVLTPVAVFDPVEIDGTEVERASVHNVSILTNLELIAGDTITVYKANMIIPQIANNLSAKEREKKDDARYIRIPSYCPVCGGITEIIKENDTVVLVCTNENCHGKLLGKLSHFVSKNAINIDGMSEATLEFMIKELEVKSFKDLYNIPFYPLVRKKWESSPGYGKKSVEKLLINIEKSRETTLDRFIYAQSIPLIGRSASKDISKLCNGNIDEFCSMMSNTSSSKKLLTIDGFGDTMYHSMLNWVAKHWIEFLALRKEFNFEEIKTEQNYSQEKNLEGKSFCITGKLEHHANRDELVSVIESHGGRYVTSVTSKTDYLINNDVASTTGKNKRAKDLNVPIISEKDFLKIISVI